MDRQDQEAFLPLMTQLADFYQQPVSEFLLETYWRSLREFDFAAVKEALDAHIRHPEAGRFMPKPADVLRLLQGSSRNQALQAWSVVTQAMRERGGYASVVFDDARTHAVIQDMGGWVTLCETTLAELPFRGHDFQARYVGFVDKAPGQYPRVLTGRLANSGRAEPPLFLGDIQKAQAVYEGGTGPLEANLPTVHRQKEVHHGQ